MDITQYIREYYDGSPDWFVEEVNQVYNQQRALGVIERKEYLSGKHKILNRQVEVWNGKEYYPRTIVLQYAKTMLNFATSYLLKNPVTLSCVDDNTTKEYQRVYKAGKFNRTDQDLLDRMLKYGDVYEYLYLNGERVTSKLIDPADGYPVYAPDNNEYIAFIEYFNADNIDYYNVFYVDRVEQWNNSGGQLRKISEYQNVSGLPIHYHNQNELDNNYGRSELDDVVGILDNMEDVLSRFGDTVFKFHSPIPVAIGQQLKDSTLPTNIVSAGLLLDDGADFKMISGQIDYKSFETLYKILKQALLDISCTPAVSMNSQDVSNLSEVSIKLLFSLADIKAALNSKYLIEGMEQRLDKIKDILNMQGVSVEDDVEIIFTLARPQNEADIIDNLKVLRDMRAISLQSVVEQNPYISNTQQELQRLEEEENRLAGQFEMKDEINDDKDKDVDVATA